MTQHQKARAVGINHVALEVGNIDEALAFYGSFLEFELRGKNASMAFIDLGDQFIALSKGREQPGDDDRHFGLVVDNKDVVRAALEQMQVARASERFLDYYDPWGNRFEIVGYEGIQFTKADSVLRGMKLEDLGKTEAAQKELAEKGMGPGTSPE